MPQYVIEREIPGAGDLSQDDLKGISQKSCGILKDMGTGIEWVHSYVTGDKVYSFIMQIMKTLSKIMQAQVVFLQIVFQKLRMLLALRQLTNNYPMNKLKTHSNEWVFLINKYYS